MLNLLRKAWLEFEDPLLLWVRAKNKLYSLWLVATYPFASVGSRLSVHYPCNFRRWTTNHIKFGNDVIVGKDSTLYIVRDHLTGIKLAIEDNCVIGARSVISVRNYVHVEPNVVMGTSVLIQDHQHTHFRTNIPIRDQGITEGGRIRIEEGCWIGQGAAIVCNEGEIVIGRNCVIGANSVVGRSVPPYSVVVGNPGIIMRQRDSGKARTNPQPANTTSVQPSRPAADEAQQEKNAVLLERRTMAEDML
jgi:acetyltransferase-like isoleucine patch superfamily enzyme